MATFTVTPDKNIAGWKSTGTDWGDGFLFEVDTIPRAGLVVTYAGDDDKFYTLEPSGAVGDPHKYYAWPKSDNTSNSNYVMYITFANALNSDDSVTVQMIQRGKGLWVGQDFTDTSTVNLSYPIPGGTETVYVNGSNITTSGSSWLTAVSVDDTEGYWIYNITATSNTGPQRAGNVNFTDGNTTVAVNAVQAGAGVLPFEVTPSSLSFNPGGETLSVSLSNIPSGGYSTTNPSWVSVLASGSTVNVTAEITNKTVQRSGTVEFTDNDDSTNTCAVTVQQGGMLYLTNSNQFQQLTHISFDRYGETRTLRVRNNPSNGYSVFLSQYPNASYSTGWITATSSGDLLTLTAQPNPSNPYDPVSANQIAVVVTDVDNSNNKKMLTAEQGGIPLSVSPSSVSYAHTGGAETIAVTYIPRSGYIIGSKPSWITVSGVNTSSLVLTASSNTSTSDRVGTVNINRSQSQLITSISVAQAGEPEFYINVSPSTVNVSEGTSTKTYTSAVQVVTYPDEYGMNSTYAVTVGSDWLSIPSYNTYLSGNQRITDYDVRVSKNNTTSSRSGELQFCYVSDGQYLECVQVPVTQPASIFSVSPTTLSFSAGGQTKTATLSNIPSGGYTTTKPNWITITTSGSTVSLQASANHTGAQRAGTVTFTDSSDSTNRCSISVSQTYSALSVSPTSLSFIPGGETKTATLSNIPTGGVTITSPSWASATREGNTITVVASSNSTGAARTGTVTITDSAHSSNTCSISLSQSKLQIAVTPTVLTFDSGGESKTVTLTNIPSGGYTTTKPNWITLSGTGSAITLTAASYTGSASRTAEVTFIDTNDSANRCVVTIVQEGEGILAIWRDIEYIPEDIQAGEDYLYRIVGPGNLDFEGLSVAKSFTGGQAYPGPINVARIVESHIHSSSSGLFDNPSNQWNVLGQSYTAAFSHIINGIDTHIKDFVFWNDWSGYRTNYSATQTLNEPINNRGAQNMLIPLCIYNTFDSSFSIVNDSSTESLGIPPYQFSIHTGSYTGEKVEFKKGADTLFSYDLTYCGQGYFIYRNRYGGWDSFLIEGNITREESYKKEQFTTTGPNYLSDSWTKRTDKTNITTTYSATTGWMTDQEAERFVYHLISSPEVYFKDFSQTAHILTPDRMISSNLTVSKTEYKQFKNGRKLTRYTITWEESKIKQIQR